MKTTLYPGLWSIKAMLMLVVMIITGCSDDKISDDSGGVTPAKDFSALMTVLRDMEKKGEISTVKQGTNASTNRPYASFYVLQPVNHYDEKWHGEESNSLWQRVCIVYYQGENAPTLLNTNGYAMDKGFDRTEDPDQYGYVGKPRHTVDDIKRWCENYLASMYIREYESIQARFDTVKERAEQLLKMGYVSDEDIDI
jgi:hypothetical protein